MKKLLLSTVTGITLISTLLHATGNYDETELHNQKENIVRELDDIDSESKETLSQIVHSGFNLKAYKENYFLPVGYRYDSKYIDNGTHKAESVETEFQVSIRYDFGSNFFGLGEIYSFGYTQRSFWQVYVPSAFFRESNYQPEFFVILPASKLLGTKSFIKGFKLAFIHQSNGRGGEYERSWNRASLSTFFQYKNLVTELELWYRFKDKQDYNPELLDYIGYGQLQFVLPYKQHLLRLKLRSNIAHRKSAVEFMYSYPLPVNNSRDLFLFVKTFNGYGESLIDYNHNVNKVSIGVAISR